MSFIILSIPHSGTRALVTALGGGVSDFRGMFDRQGYAYVFNPGHPPFWGHPESPYMDWLCAAPYALITPVRPLADIARSWLKRAADTDTESDTIGRLVEYLVRFRYISARRRLIPVDMRLVPRGETMAKAAPRLSEDSLSLLRQHSRDLLYPGFPWPVERLESADHTTAS